MVMKVFMCFLLFVWLNMLLNIQKKCAYVSKKVIFCKKIF